MVRASASPNQMSIVLFLQPILESLFFTFFKIKCFLPLFLLFLCFYARFSRFPIVFVRFPFVFRLFSLVFSFFLTRSPLIFFLTPPPPLPPLPPGEKTMQLSLGLPVFQTICSTLDNSVIGGLLLVLQTGGCCFRNIGCRSSYESFVWTILCFIASSRMYFLALDNFSSTCLSASPSAMYQQTSLLLTPPCFWIGRKQGGGDKSNEVRWWDIYFII